MSNPTTPDYSLTTLDYVVVEKTKLIDTLKTNRANHDAIYQAACSGYWEQAAKILAQRSGEYTVAADKLHEQFVAQYSRMTNALEAKQNDKIGSFSLGLSFNQQWPLTHPVNHLEDYDRVISMLEFSVADKTHLSSTDFDAYVRNNWAWRKSFTQSNLGYVVAVTGGMAPSSAAYLFAVSGCMGT